MTVKAVFLKSAEEDLKVLRSYIVKNFGADAWRTCRSKIQHAVELIQSFPDSGSIPDELERLHLRQYRQVVSGINRLIYEVRGDTAYIHIVCDARQDFKALLMRRLLQV